MYTIEVDDPPKIAGRYTLTFVLNTNFQGKPIKGYNIQCIRGETNMKKIYSLFILSILALTMFVGCQMNPEDVKDALTTTYRVNVTENTYKDNVSVDNATPKAGDTVVITITVPADFSADDLDLSVELNGTTIETKPEESTESNEVKRSFIMPESDVVVTVNFEKKATPTDTQTEVTYTITVNATNGTVTLSKTEAKAGEKVFVESISANGGYTAIGMEQKFQSKDGNVITLDFGNENGKRYFVMPECDVVINITFKATTPTDDNGDGGNSSGGDTPITYTLVGEEDNAAKYVLANLPTTDNPSEYAKDDTVTFSIKTKTGETPTELYLVKITVKERYTSDVLDITVDYNKENHTVSFKMPGNDVMVRADFYDVSFSYTSEITNDTLIVATNENTKNFKFDVGICFTEKVFDNLEYIDDKYVFRVAKDKTTETEWSAGLYIYTCKITTDLDTETGIRFVRCAIVDKTVFESSKKGQISIKSAN